MPRNRASWGPAARACVLALSVGSLAVAGAACRQDMHNQPKIIAYRESDFFPDRQGMRPIPEGTVARGHLDADELLYTGKVNGQLVDEFPFPVTREVIERGRDRFNIYCSPCHGRTGVGNGMVVQRGYKRPPSYLDDRLRGMPAGYFFDVMTNGFGQMPDYREQVPAEDRWAITAYIRALQFSEHATVADVPENKRGELDHPPAAPAAPPGEHGQQ